MNQPESKGDVQQLSKLISEIKVAMMTTVEDDGSLRSRPMMTQAPSNDGSLWFFTREHSAKVHELQHDWHTCLVYADPKGERFVSVTGSGRLVNDKEKFKQFWKDEYKAWFPKGLEDPELALVEVAITKAEYWDSDTSKMITLDRFSGQSRRDEPTVEIPPTIH
jgi:general stress protein 26